MSLRASRLIIPAAALLLGWITWTTAQSALVDYDTQIQPIFTANCAVSGCHTGEVLPFGGLSGAGLVLKPGVSREALIDVQSKNYPDYRLVVPGRSAESLLIMKLEGASEAGEQMPLGGTPLSAELIQLVKDWIDQGALADVPTAVAETSWGEMKRAHR